SRSDMRAELKSIFAWDIDLAAWTPTDTDFGIPVTLFIGIAGDHAPDAFDVTTCTDASAGGWGGRFASVFCQRLHDGVEAGFRLEADAGDVGQAHIALLDRMAVGEAAERLEDLRVGFVAAQAQPDGDVERELVAAV